MESESMMYQLYAYPNTYSVGVHLLLEEAGVPYRIINPKVEPSVTDTAFYNASPHGRVPALVLPGGSTLCESGAIALHLADSLCEQRFSIKADSLERGRYLQWLFYLSSTLQPEVMIVFHPEHYFPDSERQTALTAAAEKRLAHVWAILELEYSQQDNSQTRPQDKRCPWMFGQGPTAVDFALATVLLWPECFPGSSHDYPALEAMLKALSERESFKRIMPWHHGKTDEPPHRITVEG